MTAAPPAVGPGSSDRPGALPLERKLPLLALAVLTLVLAGSLVMSYYEVRRAALLSADERLASASRALASMIQQQTAARLAAMRRVAADTSIAGALGAPDRPPSAAAMRAMVPLVTPADSLTPPELWTADGRVVGHIRLERPEEAQRFRGEPPLQAAPSDSEHVGKLRVTNGMAGLWEAVPVRRDGRLLGFVAQERRLVASPRARQPFNDLIGVGIDFYLRNASDDTWTQFSGTAVPPPARARRFDDSLQVVTRDGRDALASTAPVGGTPLLVTLEQPMGDILARPRAVTRVLALIDAVLFVLSGLVAWAIARQLVHPLKQLTHAVEGIAQDEHALRVDGGPGDEIGRLGVAFNRMAARVEEASAKSHAAVEQLTRSVATQRFLSDASRVLSMSLSDQSLLAEVARYCVPTIADYCTIHVTDEDGTIRRVETAHRDPAKLDAVRELVARYPHRVDGNGAVPNVVRSQQPLIVRKLDPAAIQRDAPDEVAGRLLDVIRPTSFMCVPLVARGHSLGAISLTMTDSGRAFSHDDLDLAMELARRTAVAIDNTLIYRRSLALRLEAEAASTAKSDFLAKMSHEIRTPINAMMGYAELLEMGISGPVTEAQARQLSRIRASGEHLTSLVNEILDFAKLEAGGMRVDLTNANASGAVEAAIALVRPLAVAKGIELAGKSEKAQAVEYVGDPQRVQQILTNLLSNAIKFTPPGGTVLVRFTCGRRPEEAGDPSGRAWASITVEDTGVGIAAADVDRVFDPFVQADEGYTRAQGGTGLGLAISRGLAEMMGGTITLESTLGQGSRFTLWLPSPDSCTTGE